MISLDINIQDREEVPAEIADWVAPRNASFPGVDFRIGRSTPVIKEQEQEQRELATNYAITFHGFGEEGGDSVKSGVLTVSFQYGSESWYVRIIGGVTESGEYKAMANSAPGEIKKPLPAEVRNEIAGFKPEQLSRFIIEGKEDRGTKDAVIYGKKRTADNPLIDRPEALKLVEWEARMTSALSMTGAELDEMAKDSDQMAAATSLLKDAKQGQLH